MSGHLAHALLPGPLAAAGEATVRPEVPVVAMAVAAVVLLVLAALVTAAEAALRQVTRSSVAELVGAEHPSAARVERLVDDRSTALRGLAALRVVLHMLVAVGVTVAAAGLLEAWWVVALVAAGACLVLLVVVGAVGPGRIGHRRPGAVLSRLSRPTSALTSLTAALGRAGAAFAPRREPTEEDLAQESADEVQQFVDRVSDSEQLEDKQRELLVSVFELGHTYVREVMVPRTDMVSIEVDLPLAKALNLFTRSGFSRVPVHGETLDDLRGMLYLKDVIRRSHRRGDAEDLTVGDVMREPTFVPETKLVDDLLREMQTGSVHIAMVVDEYGGIAGLVTIEDLLEELVGEMVDEHDRAETVVEELGEGVWRVPARTPVDDLGELFDLTLDDDDVDTAGGLLAKVLGRVPLAGATVEVDGVLLEAERVEGRRRRVSTILARRADPEPEQQD